MPGGPAHVAIIMDGNGRWARQRRLPRVAGHRAGIEAARRVVRAAPEIGIGTLTLYAFSSENWRRPAEEVSDLMGLLLTYVRSEIDELAAADVRLSYIGEWRQLAPDIVAELERALERTQRNRGLHLVVALNYGAQQEIVRAVRAVAAEVAAGRLAPHAIDRATLEAHLDTADIPPVDLVIRSSGELRLSNFLLWQCAYAELWFTPVLWPDFDEIVLREAAEAFARRERRFGGR
ncbi:MAG: isoprenyl transferase [Thermaurantiacus sp.]|nr:isoprenyl transferase [Thermaurantiacus sp.]